MNLQQILGAIKEGLQVQLFTIRTTKVTTGSLLVVVVVVLATYLLSRLTRRAIQRFFEKKALTSRANSEVLQRISQYLIMLTGGVASLQVIGIDLSTLFAAGAIFAVGFGFAMQNIAQNFVSGIILLVERSIKQGDILEIEGQVVKVMKMGIRSTMVRTRNEEEIIVPNATLVQGMVKNYTLSDATYLLRATVGVVYSSDMRKVREVLEETGRRIPWRDKHHEPRVLMTEFADSAVNFQVFVWTHEPWIARRLTSELNEAIWWALKEAGIVIAFPQLDVHFDPHFEARVGSPPATCGNEESDLKL
jgi:small-conductance mechanosensitive channel